MLSLLIGVVILIVVLYLINAYLPIDAGLKKIINIVAGIAVLVWVIYALFGHGGTVGTGRLD